MHTYFVNHSEMENALFLYSPSSQNAKENKERFRGILYPEIFHKFLEYLLSHPNLFKNLIPYRIIILSNPNPHKHNKNTKK